MDLPPICHRFSEKCIEKIKTGLNDSKLCCISPCLAGYEVFWLVACSKMSTERDAIVSVSCT